MRYLTILLGIVLIVFSIVRANHEGRDAEYIRVVNVVAETYHKDPSEIEIECSLVDAQGNIIR